MEEGILMIKINGEIIYFDVEQIEKILSKGDNYEQKNSDLQQKKQV